MRPLSRRQKMLGFLALVVLGLLLAPFVAVQIQERIFRHRAERLLADMRSLMSHKASPEEIRAVFKRWNPDGSPRGNPCTDEQMCILEESSSSSPWMSKYDPESQRTNWWGLWMQAYRVSGGRDAHIIGRAMLHGARPRIMFALGAETAAHGATWAHDLIGEADSGEPVRIQDAWRGLTLHANYVIGRVLYPGDWDRPRAVVYVRFGESADPADIARLTTFDFSCLTRWVPCREPGDLMPEAAAQFAKEEPQLEQARLSQVCGTEIIALMARDAGRAGVVEVTGNHAEPHLDPWGVVSLPTARLIQDFKPASDWRTGESHELLILDAATDRPVTSLPAEVRPGSRFIMLAESGIHCRWVETYRCGIVPLNPANLELVRNAIAGNLPPARP